MAGVGWLLAEWVALEIYIRSPCPGDFPCDKVIGYEGRGVILVVAGGIIILCNVVIYPAKAANTIS